MLCLQPFVRTVPVLGRTVFRISLIIIRCSLVFQSIRCPRTYRPGLIHLKPVQVNFDSRGEENPRVDAPVDGFQLAFANGGEAVEQTRRLDHKRVHLQFREVTHATGHG